MSFKSLGIFTVLIHLTISAPLSVLPFDLDLFLDELTQVNVQLSDVIQRARAQVVDIKTREIQDPIAPIDVTGDGDGDDDVQVTQITESEVNFNHNQDERPHDSESVTEVGNREHNVADDNNDNDEKSTVGYALDVIGDQWSDWFNEQNEVKDKAGDSENDVHNINDDVIDQESGNSVLTPSNQTDNTKSVNQIDTKQEQFPHDIGHDQYSHDTTNNVEHERNEEDQGWSDNGGHGQDSDDTKNNNEHEATEEKQGWFDNAIDSVVDFFSFQS